MFCWGVAVVYIVVMADILDAIITPLHLIPYISRRTAVLLFWFFIMLPLSLGRIINSLRYASLGCTISTMVLVTAICTHAVENGASLKKGPLIKVERDTVSTLNTFVFSLCCQTVVSRIYSEMKNGNPCRITTAAALSMGLCSFMYIVAGAFGAAEFGSQIEASVMHNFTDELEKPYIALAFLATAVTVMMAFPMTIFLTRDYVLMVLGFTDNTNAHLSATVSILLAFLALILASAVPNVRVLFDFLGGVFGGLVLFVFPALFAMRCGFCKPSAVGWPHVLATIILFLIEVFSCVLGVCPSFGLV
ncbi:Amino acid transporter [Trypanosoma melophagium]|uniref:Amino acid transporter n=1 Tax=Trypanosoma melophagium TaxID=715481 RepID=UPI00351A1C5B|nr:Amino acid transporter [Trypanosoma melophagium]